MVEVGVDIDVQGSDLQSVVASLAPGEFIYMHPAVKFYSGDASHIERSASFGRYSLVDENGYFCYDSILRFDKKDFSGLEIWTPSHFGEEDGRFTPTATNLGEFFNGNELLYVGRDQIVEAMRKHDNSYNVGLVQYLIDNLDYEMSS